MAKKPFGSLNLLLMEMFPRYAIFCCKKRVERYCACDVSQQARTRLMYAYVRFPKRMKDAVHMHNEACRNHLEARYSTPAKEAETALCIAAFRRDHLNDTRGAETYAASAFDVARRYGITTTLERISQEFPQLLFN